ncbi:hypothetical protein JHK84_037759 [Glycine max]|nr:hypothetical protein JHK84_037759 [Glycine max]
MAVLAQWYIHLFLQGKGCCSLLLKQVLLSLKRGRQQKGGFSLLAQSLKQLIIFLKQGIVSLKQHDPRNNVCAPHLRELSYTGHGHLLRDPTLLDLSATHISSAYIYPWHSKRETEEKTVLFVCELLKQLNNNVDCLKIRWPKDLVLAHYDLPVPTFGMLSCLELGNVNGEILLIFLRNTPCLKTLILQVSN